MPRIITLTTDFGISSPYVAMIKGVILSINPQARLVDLTHAIGPQNVRQAALVLADATHWFPPETIHLAVVDPGVGTGRKIVYARIGQHDFIAPDNGLLSRLALATPPSTIITVADPRFWLPAVSATFHGRDIMAPVAARLSLGLEPQRLGPVQHELVQLQWTEARVSERRIQGSVLSVDAFGNLITNIPADALVNVPRGEKVTIVCDEHETHGIFSTYADQPAMTLIALIGSSGNLELAIVGDSATIMLGVNVGAPVTVAW
ncbi:MAG: SAM-dependent chlorinase/fluorinase [Planctomycetia bacterium]|nr:SAM-dependent chlorinase/fluorinase [Planctomycetia bacterium]